MVNGKTFIIPEQALDFWNMHGPLDLLFLLHSEELKPSECSWSNKWMTTKIIVSK